MGDKRETGTLMDKIAREKKLRTRKLETLTEKQREQEQCKEKKTEDELEHNNTADSKELILHQASMEAMY